jgi:hypothetical protein
MRTFCLGLLLSCSLIKAQVKESFNDGHLTANPFWMGDTAKWMVINGQLRSNSLIAKDTFYVSTRSTIAKEAQWELYVNLKFATSSTNYVDIYLTCDSSNLKNTNRVGYFVRIGNTSDEICLYKRAGGKNIKIIDGVNGITNTSNNSVKVKVTRDAHYLWRLKRDLTGTGLNYITEGTVIDSSITTSSYFGISVKQSTSSFYQKHFFDAIEIGSIIPDNIIPSVVSTNVVSTTQLDVLYSEYVDITTSQTAANYTLNDSLGNPSSVIRDATNPALIHLTFATPFTDSLLNTLSINGVEDFNDNVITTANVQFTYYAPAMPIFKDVIITELFADPSPSVGLPDAEFLELYNRSSKTFNLNGWLLGDASGSSTITKNNIYFAPNEYLIVCRDIDTLLYKPFGRVLGMGGFPSLNNTGDNMYVKGSNRVTVDSVSYLDSWYHNTSKKQGGWTLELINPNSSINCPASSNWTASNNTNGGTPGTINSVYSNDNSTLKLLNVTVISKDSLQLLFSNAIDTSTINNVLFYTIDNGIGNPSNSKAVNTDVKSILLTFASPLQQGVIYAVTVNSIKNCLGNTLSTNNTATFIIPQIAEANDLIINEILADPKAGGVDFVEIYNRSDKIIDLKTIFVSQYDTINNVPLKKEWIINESKLIYPNQYLIISENGTVIKSQYSTTNPLGFVDVKNLPSLNIASGTICLSTATTVIDYFKYDEAMHFALLKDTKGISLERIDFNRPTQDRTNWHSASQTVGFATPAYENSQYHTTSKVEDNIQLSPELFSPDEDGFNDVLTINYRFDAAGYVGNIKVYDSKGRLIKSLVKNELLGASGSYSWDGIDENHEKARIGVYVVHFEAFDLNGNVKHFKTPCVIASR